MREQERDAKVSRLRDSLRARHAELSDLLASMSGKQYEESVYRYYHGSLKVFHAQERTLEIVAVLQSLLPDQPLNPDFLRIVSEGTGKRFSLEMNNRWDEAARPVVEAFFHARFFLAMACRYHDTDKDQSFMPTGWAALLYLYQLR